MKRFAKKPPITPEIQERMTKAEAFGKKAFEEGKSCVPALDAEFCKECITGLKIGEGLPILDAWINGWTTANLAAPVPGMDPLPADRGRSGANGRK